MSSIRSSSHRTNLRWNICTSCASLLASARSSRTFWAKVRATHTLPSRRPPTTTITDCAYACLCADCATPCRASRDGGGQGDARAPDPPPGGKAHILAALPCMCRECACPMLCVIVRNLTTRLRRRFLSPPCCDCASIRGVTVDFSGGGGRLIRRNAVTPRRAVNGEVSGAICLPDPRVRIEHGLRPIQGEADGVCPLPARARSS